MSPTPYQQRLNPYIQRMVEDMQVRNLSPKTIDAYTYHVDKFCRHFGQPAEQLGPEEIHQYQVGLDQNVAHRTRSVSEEKAVLARRRFGVR